MRCAALALLLAALPAAAQTPSDESLNRLIELQNLPAQLRTLLPTTINVANQEVARRLAGDSDWTTEQRAALERVAARYIDRMQRELFQSESLLNEMKVISRNALRSTYTQEEVDAMIAFYGSPVGQSVLSKQGDFAKAAMPQIFRVMSEYHSQISRRMMPEFQRDLEQEMESIIQPAPRSGSSRGKSGTSKRR